jgi:hypothetical protein
MKRLTSRRCLSFLLYDSRKEQPVPQKTPRLFPCLRFGPYNVPTYLVYKVRQICDGKKIPSITLLTRTDLANSHVDDNDTMVFKLPKGWHADVTHKRRNKTSDGVIHIETTISKTKGTRAQDSAPDPEPEPIQFCYCPEGTKTCSITETPDCDEGVCDPTSGGTDIESGGNDSGTPQ